MGRARCFEGDSLYVVVPAERRDDESIEGSSSKNMQRGVLQQHDGLGIDDAAV
jgi:hypothetical protein